MFTFSPIVHDEVPWRSIRLRYEVAIPSCVLFSSIASLYAFRIISSFKPPSRSSHTDGFLQPMPLTSLAPLTEMINARDSLSFQLFQPYPRGGRAIVLRASSAKECQVWVDEIESARRKCVEAGERAIRRASRKARRNGGGSR